ncbi:hypothetical protein, partial [Cerasicoccus arenae]
MRSITKFHKRFAIGLISMVTLSLWADTSTSNSDKSELTLLEVPDVSKEELLDKQKNLARWHMGATLYDASENFLSPVSWQEADSTDTMGSLMTDDPTASFDVKPGEYRFVVDLNDSFMVNRFNFKNFTSLGSVQLYYSPSLEAPDASSWKSAAPADKFGLNQVVSPKFKPFQARYLMAHLVIDQAGVIGNMGAFGNLSVAEVRMREQKRDENIAANTASSTKSKPVKFNYASAHADSRVSYVSSGQADYAMSMIDDDVESFYDFDSSDQENVVIVDLSDQREVNSVSMLFESGPGNFDFYVVNKLPDDVKDVLDRQEKDAAKKADSSTTKADDDMAMIFNRGQWEPLLLAQNGDDALSSIVNFAGDAIFSTISLPGDFFSELSPTVEQKVDGSAERFRIDFSNLTGRFLIIRFMPDPGSGATLRIYEISLMGDIIADEDGPVERITAFSLFGGAGAAGLAPPPTQVLAPPAPPPNVRPPP